MNKSDNRSPVQWLRILFYIELAGLGLSLLDYLPIDSNWISWPKRVLLVGMIYCLFRLTDSNRRYRKAAVFRTLQLTFVVINVALSSYFVHLFTSMSSIPDKSFASTLSFLVGAVATVASWIALYQLYNAHGDLVAEKDPALAQKWRRLFPIAIIVGLLMSTASVILTMIQVFLNVGVTTITSAVMTIIMLPDEIITLASLVYLYRTIKILENQEE